MEKERRESSKQKVEPKSSSCIANASLRQKLSGTAKGRKKTKKRSPSRRKIREMERRKE